MPLEGPTDGTLSFVITVITPWLTLWIWIRKWMPTTAFRLAFVFFNTIISTILFISVFYLAFWQYIGVVTPRSTLSLLGFQQQFFDSHSFCLIPICPHSFLCFTRHFLFMVRFRIWFNDVFVCFTIG